MRKGGGILYDHRELFCRGYFGHLEENFALRTWHSVVEVIAFI